MEKKLTKGDLDQLTSNIWYSNFERGEECFEHVSFYSEIKDELENTRYWYYGLSKISQNIVRALCYIYNRKINHQINFDNDRCSYLYYWLGDKIYSRVHDKKIFSIIIKMVYDEIYRTKFLNACKPHYENIDEHTFNTYKILHDYSKDYRNINLNTLHGHTTCDEHYKMVIEKYINTYRDVYSNCRGNNEKKYDCAYFDKLFDKYEHTNLKSFHCMKPNVQKIHADEKEKFEPSRPSTSLSRTTRDTPVSLKYTNPQGNDGQNMNNNLHEAHGLAGRQVLGSHVSIPTDDTAESGSTKSIMGSVVPVLGVSSISLLLYKVTPVGGFINKLLGRNINMYNAIEGMDEFNPYSDGMDPGGRTMNISYHRL